jgi:hypothetical protein
MVFQLKRTQIEAYENRELWRIFGPKRKGVKAIRRKQYQ